MILYKKKSKPIFRYALAIIIFTLGLTLTVVDVYGLQMPYSQRGADSHSTYQEKKIEINDNHEVQVLDIRTDNFNDDTNGDDNPPTSVPEPSTIILLASGLGLYRMANRKKR